MRIERGGNSALAATLGSVRPTGGTLTAALRLGDQEWRLVLEAEEIGSLHAAIHEWFKSQEPGLPGPGRGER
jgi:hypothetical protein